MIRRKLKIVARGALLVAMAVVLVLGDPSTAVLAAPHEGDEENKGNLFYYTYNGIIFYEGGELHCSATGGAVSGGAAGMLQKQKGLGGEWVPTILNAAKQAGADPIAMASLLFWENRGFPAFDAKWGGSDSIGRGPWQITKGTWPSGAGSYASGVIDPKVSTPVAADLVKSWGGVAGSPIGSIDQDFGKGKNINSMATVAKNYNAGRATWRSPGVAGFKTQGRTWMKASSGPWFAQKQEIIDEYILAMTYAYYLIGTGQSLPRKGELDNDAFVKRAQQNAQAIKDFKVGDGANAANDCEGTTASTGNGNIEATARSLAWPNRKYEGSTRKSSAKKAYQVALPQIHGAGNVNNDPWTDCGMFVSTVMRLSGADKKYMLRGTGNQLAYVQKSSKYTVKRYKNYSQLKPGDVFIVANGKMGHTFVHGSKYKGDDGKNYDGYSASWGSRVPMANRTVGSADQSNDYYFAHLKTNPGEIAPPPTGAAQP